MGSPAHEAERKGDEAPQHDVSVAGPFAVSKYEVTRDQFERFVSQTGHDYGDSCSTYESGRWELRKGRTFRDPGYPQTGDHPVVCVSWDDAQAYAGWLSRKCGKKYRLLTEAEWEYAARAGTTTSRYWGDDPDEACTHANVYDDRGRRANRFEWSRHGCDDGFGQTSPAGRFRPNRFGLHDMLGNVWEWVQDCYHDSYTGAPENGSAWVSGPCQERVLRGGSWVYIPPSVRSANRGKYPAGTRNFYLGFRVAADLGPAAVR